MSSHPPSHGPRTYTPGYAGRKLLMTIAGLAILLFGCTQIWTPMRLLLLGARTEAAATRVIKSKAGLPDLPLTSDLQIKAASEMQDRSWTFWNEFRFQTAAGQPVIVRPQTGSQLKPLYPLLDEDGLPTSILVCYDPAHPHTVLFPGIFSTWFAPAAVTLLGLLCTVTGLFLFYWAGRPIDLPHIAFAPEPDTGQGGNPLTPSH